MATTPEKFTFSTYEFDYETLTADFRYISGRGMNFRESIKFAEPGQPLPLDDRNFVWLLDSALKLAFYLIGISYYKAHPTKAVKTFGLDAGQARFFSTVYQDGLSQFAFTNQLTRADLATFEADAPENLARRDAFRSSELGENQFPKLTGFSDSALVLQSGGKDSLVNAVLQKGHPHTFWYLSSGKEHPSFLDQLDAPLQIANRRIDYGNLAHCNGLNGHVPITYITMSLALVQAILNRQTTVLTSIGQEGNEPHCVIRANGSTDTDFAKPVTSGDLSVNHQWSKTDEAEQLFRDYVHTYISPELDIYSPLRQYTELKIAKLFAEKCWDKYGHQFSSCNEANYRQGADNHELKWCGNCSKCANSYLLFTPFVPRKELDDLFGGKSLFENSALTQDFKDLLGVGTGIKPFECVGEIDELRYAYHQRRPEYPSLPFDVPKADFDLNRPPRKLTKSGK